ncbi:hypothetical protein GCM10009557_44530 [Virgisporangium ochraceum]|uniref:Uncharacterized protein n=1 Tax=Virgisporangium ochraceum TaxID=65505 RepID=A0A8J3ZY75_9ACTN|nr:hypothetical protein [Virgisporangium ochraceum]GIJ70403.1 hypothetical protein Voc01_053200 [Virgisporangium ochraceum]
MTDRWSLTETPAMYPGDDQESRCPATSDLTAPQSATLAALPSVIGPVLRTVTCELALGHDGDHIAFTGAADDGERWWWLYWASDRHRLIQVDTCARASINGPHRDECLLAQDHSGPHSFDIRATCVIEKAVRA